MPRPEEAKDILKRVADTLGKTMSDAEKKGPPKPDPLSASVFSAVKISDATLSAPEITGSVEATSVAISRPPHLIAPWGVFDDLTLVSKAYKLDQKDIDRIINEGLPTEIVSYKKAIGEGQLEFEFSKDLQPNPALMTDTFMATIHYATQQKKANPTFTLADKAKFLGITDEQIQKGGDIFKNIEKTELCLANGRYTYWNKKTGKESIRKIGSFYADLEIKGEGKGRTFTALLNPEFFKTMDFVSGEVKGRYVKYPTRYLPDKTLTHYDKNFLNWLVQKQGLSETSMNAERILKEILNIAPAYYKRKEYCLECIARVLELARIEGYTTTIYEKGKGDRTKIKYLEKYTIEQFNTLFADEMKKLNKNIVSFVGDARKWKITFTATKLKGNKSQGRKYVLGAYDDVLINKIVEWGYTAFNKPTTPKDEAIKQWRNVVRGIGGKTLEKIFTPIGLHPELYWSKKDKTITPYTFLWGVVRTCLARMKKTPDRFKVEDGQLFLKDLKTGLFNPVDFYRGQLMVGGHYWDL